MDFIHEDTYLLRPFPRSLKGQALEWFTKLSPPIKTFHKLARRFTQHYSYNIQQPITMIELAAMKQHQGEPFVTYLQCWRSLYSQYPCQLPKREKIDIFVNILMPKLYYDLRKQLFTTFNDMVESAYQIEDVAIRKGDLVLNWDTRNHGKDRGKPWNKKKNIVNDGVVDTPKLKELVFNLSNAIYAANQQEAAKSQSVSRPQQTDKPKKYTQ